MDKPHKVSMSPFTLSLPIAEAFKSRLKREGLKLTEGYERALKQWAEEGANEGVGTSTQGTVHCPPGMALIPSVPVPAPLHRVLTQEAGIVEGWPNLVRIMGDWYLEAKHRTPKEYTQPPKVKRTPEQKRADKAASIRQTAGIRFNSGFAPIIGGLVFKHRPPHPNPWEVLGLQSPEWEGFEVMGAIHPQAKELFDKEVAEIEARKALEAKERAEREALEPPKPRRFKFENVQGCGVLLELEMEALKAGRPVSSVVMPNPEDFA